MNTRRTKLNEMSGLLWVWLPQSGMKGGGPDLGEASSDKGVFRLGEWWEEMNVCSYPETETRKERQILQTRKREIRNRREIRGVAMSSLPSPPPHLSLSDA